MTLSEFGKPAITLDVLLERSPRVPERTRDIEQINNPMTLEKLQALAASGIRTIVDPTVVGLGRFIPRIQKVAAEPVAELGGMRDAPQCEIRTQADTRHEALTAARWLPPEPDPA